MNRDHEVDYEHLDSETLYMLTGPPAAPMGRWAVVGIFQTPEQIGEIRNGTTSGM